MNRRGFLSFLGISPVAVQVALANPVSAIPKTAEFGNVRFVIRGDLLFDGSITARDIAAPDLFAITANLNEDR